jgi:hypothetical protein
LPCLLRTFTPGLVDPRQLLARHRGTGAAAAAAAQLHGQLVADAPGSRDPAERSSTAHQVRHGRHPSVTSVSLSTLNGLPSSYSRPACSIAFGQNRMTPSNPGSR